MKEIWQPVPGKLGRKYAVSNYGRVRSLDAWVRNRYGVRLRLGRVLKPGKTTKGYLFVVLSDNSKQRPYSVHRLVGKVFVPNPTNLPEINHLDFDKSNNHFENLEWTTRSGNNKHAHTDPKRRSTRKR